jgi:hypothetical protein
VYHFTYSSLRFYDWPVAVLLGPLLGLLACSALTFRAWKRLREAEQARTWLTLAVLVWLALLLACLEGDQNYNWYVTNYYNYQDSASYTDIDPLHDRGQSYMDAGQVYFREGTYVAKEELSAFKSSNLYCVAPIVGQPIRNQVVNEQAPFSWYSNDHVALQEGRHGTPKLRLPESGTVDFWAVGMDCCNKTSGEFWCGQVGKWTARAGMRMLRDDSRPYYMLAVQAWAAQRCPENVNTVRGTRAEAPLICLPAKHPLFFYWVVDPIHEVDMFAARSSKLFLTELCVFAAVDAVLLFVLWRLFWYIGVR